MASDETSGTAQLLARTRDGALLYGLTPPRRTLSSGQADAVARAALARLRPVQIDGLVLYDVDAEADRSSTPRPFPFMPMMDPADFLDLHLADWAGPVVVYRAVSKYTEAELGEWLSEADRDRVLTVLVGAASPHRVGRSLHDAYRQRAALSAAPRMGGVVIAERHAAAGAEHERMLHKQRAGCEFFVSQVCYDLDNTRNLLSDYVYSCRDRGLDPRPVVLTLAPCGSVKTLEFMLWLGIDVPGWLRTEITHSEDPLTSSYKQCVVNAEVLISFCRRLGLPFGINVESLTNRRVEIDASIELVRAIRSLLS